MTATLPILTFPLSAIPGDLTNPADLTRIRGWHNDQLRIAADGTHFGFVASGGVSICSGLMPDFVMAAGNYFALTGPLTLTPQSADSAGIVMTRLDYLGLNQVGGPIEKEGRLKYIDGCTDTLLVAPPRKGDACLNLLHFPPGIDQTSHSHPSLRCGVVASGRGVCVGDSGTLQLETGMGFMIPAGAMHKFQTDDSSMSVIAYHPDSDFGPEDDDHPMINRTIVAGQSARFNREIRTR